MDIISISQKTSKCLFNLNDLSKDDFAKTSKYFLQQLITGQTGVDSDDVKEEPLNTLSVVLLESARVHATAEQLSSLLKEQLVDSNISTSIVEMYSTHFETLVKHMENTCISAPEIVGLEWRLDYSLTSKNGGRVNSPMYLVTLRVKERGLVREMDMIASREEVQDMLSKLKDAVKQVERLLNSSSQDD